MTGIGNRGKQSQLAIQSIKDVIASKESKGEDARISPDGQKQWLHVCKQHEREIGDENESRAGGHLSKSKSGDGLKPRHPVGQGFSSTYLPHGVLPIESSDAPKEG